MSARVRRSQEQVGGGGPRIPVITLDSGEIGPVVCVGANLHGDECTGLGVVHALDRRLPGALKRGRVHLYPSLNPLGLEQGSRRVPGDGLDPNRAFPGSTRGSRAERHADRLWRELLGRRPELYIDLHTDTAGAVPYAIVDRVVRGPRAAPLAARCRVLAAASGLTVLGEYPPDRYVRFDLDRSLPGALVNGPGVPALTLEVGPRRRVDPAAVEDAVAGVLGVLHSMGMGGAQAEPHESRMGGGPWRRESGPRTGRSGVLVPVLPPGARFQRGAALAEVRSLDGEIRERLHAADAGFVVALPEVAHVEIGTSCATLAVKDEAPA
jgi:uncharacterized protein